MRTIRKRNVANELMYVNQIPGDAMISSRNHENQSEISHERSQEVTNGVLCTPTINLNAA